ncbi:MAG: hypothetical protein GX318_07475, partial [Clostridia bacterium]|nr:hypothetical protein [Clostridia bacterium]
DGGTEVTIRGSNFKRGIVVTVGGIEALEVQLLDGNTIKAVTPSHTRGPKDVTVVNTDGGNATLEGGFNYRDEPGTPGWLRAYTHDAHTVRLEWEEADFANYYEIYTGTSSTERDLRFVDQTKSRDTEYYVTDLNPNTRYYFQVRAVNELGISQFTGNADAKTDRGRSKTETRIKKDIQIVMAPNRAVVMIPDRRAMEGYDYFFDLSGPRYQNAAVKALQLNGNVAKDLNQAIYLKLDDGEIIIPPGVWNVPELNNLSARDRSRAVVRFVVEDMGPREVERALRIIGGGAQAASRAHALHLEVQSSGMLRKSAYFPTTVEMGFNVPVGTANRPTARIYKHDSGGIWSAAQPVQRLGDRLSHRIFRPAALLLVY